jgi:hypothetical protein
MLLNMPETKRFTATQRMMMFQPTVPPAQAKRDPMLLSSLDEQRH